MKDADVQRMFRQLDLILNLIQETRRLRKFSISGQRVCSTTGKGKFWKP